MALVDVIKKIFGSKAERDIKQIRPVLQQVLDAYSEIDKLTNDELRARTVALKEKVKEIEEPFEKRIAEIKAMLVERLIFPQILRKLSTAYEMHITGKKRVHTRR